MTLEKEQLVSTLNYNKESNESQVETLSNQVQILNGNDQQVMSLVHSDQDSIEAAAPKVIESTGHSVKDSLTV